MGLLILMAAGQTPALEPQRVGDPRCPQACLLSNALLTRNMSTVDRIWDLMDVDLPTPDVPAPTGEDLPTLGVLALMDEGLLTHEVVAMGHLPDTDRCLQVLMVTTDPGQAALLDLLDLPDPWVPVLMDLLDRQAPQGRWVTENLCQRDLLSKTLNPTLCRVAAPSLQTRLSTTMPLTKAVRHLVVELPILRGDRHPPTGKKAIRAVTMAITLLLVVFGTS